MARRSPTLVGLATNVQCSAAARIDDGDSVTGRPARPRPCHGAETRCEAHSGLNGTVSASLRAEPTWDARCKLGAMKRAVAGLLLGLLAVAAFAGRPTLAALGVAVSVSPAEGVVGRPIEVLLRTFVPIGEGDVALPVPTLAYPAASGLWNVLYPIADYPFDVAAQAEDGTTVALQLTRDPNDATLWRGTFTPTKSGEWTIAVRNFPADEPGASARVSVAPGESLPAVALVGVAALLIGVLVGLFLGRRGRDRSRPTT